MSVSLKDVAAQLGVSISAVSKTINNRPGVSDELRKKIHKALMEMNFEPKQTAKGLVKKENHCINVCIKTTDSVTSDPFYSQILEGISNELQPMNISLVLNLIADENLSEERFASVFSNPNVASNIILGASFSDEFIRRLETTKTITILVDNSSHAFSSVNPDNFDGGMQAMKHLLELGHKEIAFLAGSPHHKSIQQRLFSFREAHHLYLENRIPTIIYANGLSPEEGYEAIKNYSGKPFTALFTANDKLAIGSIRALKEIGFAIPKDVSIVGFDDIEWGLHTDPPLTTVRIPKHQIGKMAIQLFMNIYNQKEIYPVDIKVSTKLIVRNSTSTPS